MIIGLVKILSPCVLLKEPKSSLFGLSTGADIANVVNEAALHAARHAKKVVTANDLEYAVERVVGGTEKRSQVGWESKDLPKIVYMFAV